jgi:hypothetical protein
MGAARMMGNVCECLGPHHLMPLAPGLPECNEVMSAYGAGHQRMTAPHMISDGYEQ